MREQEPCQESSKPLTSAQRNQLEKEFLRQQEHKRLVRNNLNLTWNKGKLSIVEQLLSPDFYYKTSFNDALLTRSEYLEYVRVFRRAMPDLELSIEEMMAEGDRVISRITFSGTVEKDFFGIPASDRVIAFEAISMWDISFGKITQLETLLNMSMIERQVKLALPAVQDLVLDN